MSWSRLIRPRRLDRNGDATRGDFVCEPLSRGCGDEIGRALRRALLHSVPGKAIVAARVQSKGAPPSAAWMRSLCLNASQLVVAATETQTVVRVDAARGASVRAEALGIDVVSGEHELCTAPDDLLLELWLGRGCGMRFGSTLLQPELPADAWPVDAFFAPVRCADFFTERSRVGPWRDLESLLIHIETNGAVSADEALWTATRALSAELCSA